MISNDDQRLEAEFHFLLDYLKRERLKWESFTDIKSSLLKKMDTQSMRALRFIDVLDDMDAQQAEYFIRRLEDELT